MEGSELQQLTSDYNTLAELLSDLHSMLTDDAVWDENGNLGPDMTEVQMIAHLHDCHGERFWSSWERISNRLLHAIEDLKHRGCSLSSEAALELLAAEAQELGMYDTPPACEPGRIDHDQ